MPRNPICREEPLGEGAHFGTIGCLLRFYGLCIWACLIVAVLVASIGFTPFSRRRTDALPFMWALVIIAAMMHSHVPRLPIAPTSDAELRACWARLQTMLNADAPDLFDCADYSVDSRGPILHTHSYATDHLTSPLLG